ncbi:MAG: hypothetical protein GXY41_05410 [Phycisphaerae bacterium]|mgnify:CR=1 FL=1|jgi:GNAT superfamily N-acetyltransferase|nr:hypothetical protein [Phycisphaerae bacterium]
MSPCTLTSQLQLIRADIRAYRALRRYHYCDGALGPYCAIYALVKEGVTALPGTVNSDHSWVAALPGGAGNDGELTETVAGVIVYAPSPLNNAARDRATGGFFAMRPKAEKLALLNAHVRRISRVIIEPRYRGLGLAVRLVRDTLPLAGVAMVEASAAMGHLHPFFERAGMRAYRPAPDPARRQVERAFDEAGIDAALRIDPAAVHARMSRLPQKQYDRVENAVHLFLNRFGRRRTMPPGVERTAFVLNRLGVWPVYYTWRNPEQTVEGLDLAGE